MTDHPLTDAQQHAIEAQAAVYGTDPTICQGLHHYTVKPASEDAGPYPPGAVAAMFHYVPENGEGLGLEVTVYAVDGTVLDSQDFG